jgi:DNA-binding GntR family transcriptional regulator
MSANNSSRVSRRDANNKTSQAIQFGEGARRNSPTPPVKLPPRRKLGEEATRRLRDTIMSGTYPAGYRMGIDELARDLGVSTMPVREALIALANEGLLEVLPRRGFRVAAISRQDVEDVFRVHALVAGELAERAARAIDAETIARLKEVQEDIESISQSRMAASVRSTRIEQANYTFHRMINHSSDSERLRWFLRAATRFVPRQFYEAIPGWMETTVHDHPQIIAALEQRKAGQSRRLMTEHVSLAGELVVSELERTGFWPET